MIKNKRRVISLSIKSNSKDYKNILNSLNPKHYDFSTWLLIISNIIILVIAIVQNINILELMWLYLGQSLIIGFFTFIKILTLKKFSTENFSINGVEPKPTFGTKIITAFFFMFHYGGFHLVYAGFLGFFTTLALSDSLNYVINYQFFIFGLGTFFINHLISFIINYKKDSDNVKNIGTVMILPYARIIPMHFIMFIGGMFGSILISFLVLKTIADVVMHQVEHNI